MTLTIKLDRNWNSFQLANSTPPLSVTGNAIAPSARINMCGFFFFPDDIMFLSCWSGRTGPARLLVWPQTAETGCVWSTLSDVASEEQRCSCILQPRECKLQLFFAIQRIDKLCILTASYLLGLLAMIKCSICSYQCDNWYVSNWRLACHLIFNRGGSCLGLPSTPQMLPWHGTLLWATHPQG